MTKLQDAAAYLNQNVCHLGDALAVVTKALGDVHTEIANAPVALYHSEAATPPWLTDWGKDVQLRNDALKKQIEDLRRGAATYAAETITLGNENAALTDKLEHTASEFNRVSRLLEQAQWREQLTTQKLKDLDDHVYALQSRIVPTANEWHDVQDELKALSLRCARLGAENDELRFQAQQRDEHMPPVNIAMDGTPANKMARGMKAYDERDGENPYD